MEFVQSLVATKIAVAGKAILAITITSVTGVDKVVAFVVVAVAEVVVEAEGVEVDSLYLGKEIRQQLKLLLTPSATLMCGAEIAGTVQTVGMCGLS
jgi:hypothetical protein